MDSQNLLDKSSVNSEVKKSISKKKNGPRIIIAPSSEAKERLKQLSAKYDCPLSSFMVLRTFESEMCLQAFQDISKITPLLQKVALALENLSLVPNKTKN